MKDEIEDKVKEFKNRMSLQMEFLNLKGDFNLKSIMKSLEVNFKYVAGQVVDAGLSILGVVFAFAITPILGVVAGILAFARKIWDWFFGDPDKRKREAKSKAVNEIDSMISSINNEIIDSLKREFGKIKRDTEKPAEQLRKSMKGIKKISLSIDDKITEIKKFQISLSLLLMKKILSQSVIFSYVDLQISEAVVIGYGVNAIVKAHLLTMFRLAKIDLYPSYNDWLRESGTQNGATLFMARDEFDFRALNALSLHDSSALQFKKIIRKDNK